MMQTRAARAPDTIDDFVAEVATARVKAKVANSPAKKSLFRIVGLDPQLTSRIATRIADDVGGAEVYVHQALAYGHLDASMLTTKTATHFRNMERPQGGGAIVFAVPTEHLDVVGATVGEIKQISNPSLENDPDLWLDAAPELSRLDERSRRYVRNFLLAVVEAGILSGEVRMLAEFVLRLDKAHESAPIWTALDEALPALRIPKGAGGFKKFGQRGRLKSVEKWKSELGDIHRRAEDALYLRDDRGTPLDRARLRERVDELLEDARLEPDEAETLGELVADDSIAPGRWQPTQQAAAELRWSAIESLVKARKTTAKKPLGEETIAFFDHAMPKALTDEEREIVAAIADESGVADELERDIFFRHREELKGSKRLLKRWETYVFRKTEEHPNLLAGLLLAVADLIGSVESPPDDPRLVIKLDGADKLAYWTAKDREVCRFLRDRYRGLPELLSPVAMCDFGLLWSHSEAWDSDSGGAKTARSARQFKFDIFLLDATDLPGEGAPTSTGKGAQHSTQLVWTLPADSFASAYSANMHEVANLANERALLALGRFARAYESERVAEGAIDLRNRASVQDVHDEPDGVLVDVNESRFDMGRKLSATLGELGDDILAPRERDAIRSALESFHEAYTHAVRAFVTADGQGLCEKAVYRQAELYGELLDLLRRTARRDPCRNGLWHPALSIGLARSDHDEVAAITCPWHPFRLAEAKAKAEHLADALAALVRHGSDGSDLRTFARSLVDAMDSGWHPAVALYPDTPHPRLMVETENFADFGLMEPPTRDEGAADAFDGTSKEARTAFAGIAEEYLQLHPHERANLSLVLYNADNRDLPSRLAEDLARKIEDETDLRCDLILTHTDQQRLRRIYAEQNVAISRELDGVLASEAAQSFLSRLRVAFLDAGSVANRRSEGARGADVVFLHDVIARNAHTNWRRIDPPASGWPSFRAHRPDEQTRRQSHEIGSRKSEAVLVPAVRPLEVQRYLDLTHDLHLDAGDLADAHHAPIREVVFDEPDVSGAIAHAHAVGNWVVTFDGVADPQLLKNNHISVIRYITRPGSDHNLLVSTRRADATLRRRIQDDLTPILGAGDAPARIADKCIEEASRVSGRVVLNAARLGPRALELLGLVLSKQVLSDSLPAHLSPVAWLLLDDYADWLGHRGKMADLLVLCVGELRGRRQVEIIVVESKYVALSSHGEEARSALSQAKASTDDLRERVVLGSDPLNQPVWRSRLADLLIEHGVFPPAAGGPTPTAWADMIRSRQADVGIRGVSLVFVHDCDADTPPPLTADSEEQRQYVFDRTAIARGLRRIDSAEAPPLEIDLPPAAADRPEAAEDRSDPPATGPAPGTGDPVMPEPAKRDRVVPEPCTPEPVPPRPSAGDLVTPASARQEAPSTASGGGGERQAPERGGSRAEMGVPPEGPQPAASTGAAKAPAPRAELTSGGSDGSTAHGRPGSVAAAAGPPQSAGDERFPPPVRLYLGGQPTSAAEAEAEGWLAETADRLRLALRGYGLRPEIIGSRLTPNAGLVRFRGSDKMTVALVEKHEDVLYTSHGLEVIGVRPGRGEVVVMVARERRATLLLTDLWKRRGLPPGAPVENGSFLIGERETDGGLVYLNLFGEFGEQPEHGPHTLIAGESGGGKGVLARNILLDMCATNAPSAMRVHLIDPKFGGDYRWIEGMPHLKGGIVTDRETAEATLAAVVAEMERRYTIITRLGPNIDKYNARVAPGERLPRIIVMHDEIGDWMADKASGYREVMEANVGRLAQKARAAGIHLFLITQRPDAEIVTGSIKANMTNKIALRVSSGTNARIILDETGAERLLGKGHFAAKLANERAGTIFGQAPFIEDEDAWDLARAIRSHWG